MKEISRYEANDGTVFSEKNECTKHEHMIADINNLLLDLPKRPKDDSCKFANGHGYIQHEKKNFLDFEKKFYKMACEYHKELNKYPMNSYGFWRFLDDTGSPFYRAGQRILCTNKNTYREYGQPFFAGHPDQAENFQIN